MDHKIFNQFILRSPILPLNCENENIEEMLSNVRFKKVVEDLKLSSNDAILKYVKRCSYRTTPLKNMVNIYRCVFECNQSISILKKEEKSANYSNIKVNFSSIADYLLQINPFLKKIKNGYVLKNNNEYVYVESSDLIDKILFNCEQIILKSMLINKLIENGLDKSQIQLAVKELENSYILISDLNDKKMDLEYTSTSNKNNYLRKKENIDIAINKKDLSSVYRCINILSSIYIINGYEDCIDYFLDKYNNRFVPVLDVIKDYDFQSYIKKIEYVLNEESVFFKKIIYDINQNLSENSIFLTSKDLIAYATVPLVDNYDIYCNILKEEENILINLDTGHRITRAGNANILFEDNKKYSFNHIYGNSELNSLTNKTECCNVISNKLSAIEKDVNYKDIYIGVISKKFIIYNLTENRQVDFQKFNMIDLQYIDPHILTILLLSNISNLDIPINLNYHLKQFSYIPRIIIDNNIISRKRWYLDYKSVMHHCKNFKDFQSILAKFRNLWNLESHFCLVDGDVELLLDYDKIEDQNIIYNRLIVDGEILIKENVQRYSSLFINNQHYANECIITTLKNREISQKVEIPSFNIISEKVGKQFLPFDEYLNLNVYISYPYINYLKFLNTFLFIVKDYSKYYFINYKNDIGKAYLKIRLWGFKSEKIHDLLKTLSATCLIEHFDIKTYYPEIYRYYNLGIKNYELFSYLDSKRTIRLLNKVDDIKELLILNILSYILSFKITGLELKEMFRYYINGHQNRTLIKEYEAKFENLMKFVFKVYYDQSIFSNIHTDILLFLDLLHMSNNRLSNADIELEKEVMKYIGICYMRRIYANLSL